MELINIDDSKVIYLFQVRRQAGQLYLPEAARRLVERYSFAQPPSLQQLTTNSDFIPFRIGKFADTQIQDFKVYSDGFIIEAKSNTNVLDAFLDDLLGFTKELGLEPIAAITPEKYYESALIVHSSKDLAGAITMPPQIIEELNKSLKATDPKRRVFQTTGFISDSDSSSVGGRRKELRFLIDRRSGIAFKENIFFSQAPLPTDAHLALLEVVERAAR